MTDGELLAEYRSSGSEEAFAEVVRRHADMVYRVCLRILGEPTLAEDATQAAFLVLLHKARKLSRKTFLPGWLFKVAEYTARNACRMRARRARHEREAAKMRAEKKTDVSWEDVRPHLDACLASLPRRQRDVVVLRYLYRQSEAKVARELRCPQGTVSSLLSRGLKKLREKLSRKGFAVPAVLLATFLGTRTAEAAPAALAASLQAACMGKAAASSAATAIAEGVVKAMMWTKVQTAALVAGVVLVACVSTPVAVRMAREEGKPTPVPATAEAKAPAEKSRPAAERPSPAGDGSLGSLIDKLTDSASAGLSEVDAILKLTEMFPSLAQETMRHLRMLGEHPNREALRGRTFFLGTEITMEHTKVTSQEEMERGDRIETVKATIWFGEACIRLDEKGELVLCAFPNWKKIHMPKWDVVARVLLMWRRAEVGRERWKGGPAPKHVYTKGFPELLEAMTGLSYPDRSAWMKHIFPMMGPNGVTSEEEWLRLSLEYFDSSTGTFIDSVERRLWPEDMSTYVEAARGEGLWAGKAFSGRDKAIWALAASGREKYVRVVIDLLDDDQVHLSKRKAGQLTKDFVKKEVPPGLKGRLPWLAGKTVADMAFKELTALAKRLDPNAKPPGRNREEWLKWWEATFPETDEEEKF